MGASICENVNNTVWDKNCLLKYITKPFTNGVTWHFHQSLWQVRELAKIIGEFGYNVDVVDYYVTDVRVNKKYDLLIDNYPQNLHLLSPCLTEHCCKVFYSTTAGPTWQYRQEMARFDALFARRGVKLAPCFAPTPYDSNINAYDAMFLIGNEFTRSTYADFKIKQTFLIKNTGYPSLACFKTANKDARTFLFLLAICRSSTALICCSKYLHSTKTLILLFVVILVQKKISAGFMSKNYFSSLMLFLLVLNIESDLFKNICQVASFVVLPFCTEGMPGNVLTAMSAGLIPIVSPMCGLEADEVFLFTDCTIEGISQTLTHFSKQQPEWIHAQMQRAINIIQRRYSPANYIASVRAAMHGLLQKN